MVSSIDKVLENLSDIPTLPDIVAKVTQLITNPETTATDVSDALSRDPGLSAKILKIVNSAFYGFPRRITTITNAVVILGFIRVRNLALSAYILDNYGTGVRVGFDMRAFWKHSIGVAFMAAQIARRIDSKLEEDAFICGLLHDLGKGIMAQKASVDMANVIEAVKKDNLIFLDAERRILDYDHVILGGAIAERWNLPKVMVNVMRYHHEPATTEVEGQDRILVAAINVADIMAKSLFMGASGDNRIPRLSSEAWAILGIDWETLERAARRALGEFQKSDTFFSI